MKVSYTNIDEMPSSLIEHILAEERVRNEQIEDTLTREVIKQQTQRKAVLLGEDWGRKVFLTQCKLLTRGGGTSLLERQGCLDQLRSVIVEEVLGVANSDGVPKELKAELQEHILSLKDYPPSSSISPTPPPAFLDQTLSILYTLWTHPQLQSTIKQQLLSGQLDPILPIILPSQLSVIFDPRQPHIPTDVELLFVAAHSPTTSDRIHEVLLDEPSLNWNIQLTDIANIQQRRRLLDHFESVSSVLFFVDILGNYSAVSGSGGSSELVMCFEGVVNGAFVGKKVILVGYNKGRAEQMVKEGICQDLEGLTEPVFRPFLQKRSEGEMVTTVVELCNREEVANLLNTFFVNK